MKLNDKRSLGKVSTDLGGLNWSVGLSESSTIADDDEGLDVNITRGHDDVAGVETTIGRLQLTPHTSLRLNGPAISFDTSSSKASLRILGLSLAHEVVTDTGRNQISGEVKITDTSLMGAMTGGPQAAIHAAHTMLQSPTTHTALNHALMFLLPVVVAGLTVRGLDNISHDLKAHGSGSAMRGAGRIVGRAIRAVDQAVSASVQQVKMLGAYTWGWFKNLVN